MYPVVAIDWPRTFDIQATPGACRTSVRWNGVHRYKVLRTIYGKYLRPRETIFDIRGNEPDICISASHYCTQYWWSSHKRINSCRIYWFCDIRQLCLCIDNQNMYDEVNTKSCNYIVSTDVHFNVWMGFSPGFDALLIVCPQQHHSRYPMGMTASPDWQFFRVQPGTVETRRERCRYPDQGILAQYINDRWSPRTRAVHRYWH